MLLREMEGKQGSLKSHNSVNQQVIVGSGFKYCGEGACLGMEIT